MTTGNYTTFCGRPRALKPAGKPIQLSAQADLQVRLENMFNFAGIYIQRARDLAKAGKKDEARDWFRFFNNSQIIACLEKSGVTGDVKTLRENLNFLGLECHPLDTPDFSTDLQSIRNCLNEILSHVKKAKQEVTFTKGLLCAVLMIANMSILETILSASRSSLPVRGRRSPARLPSGGQGSKISGQTETLGHKVGGNKKRK